MKSESVISEALEKLRIYCEKEGYKGYDPYDTLNSFIPFNAFGKWTPSVAIQIQKRNPVNIRPLLGIKKGINPKAMGLFLKAYCNLYKKTGREEYLQKADEIFQWLRSNYSRGYAGYAWGYNFDWATPGSYLKAYTPSVVVTSFVIDGVFNYYLCTKKEAAADLVLGAADFIIHDIPVIQFNEGISFMYTQQSKDACYNASMLAAEVLAKADYIHQTKKYYQSIDQAVTFVLSMQKEDGSWNYSFNPINRTERVQIDFHQGFILVSLNNINELTKIHSEPIDQALKKGLHFYNNQQFKPTGQSLWRLPAKWPVDIHNQAQGIITFHLLQRFDNSYRSFAQKIADWTISHMQDKTGYFYYRKYPLLINKISYMRWSQAWMMLAFSELI